MFRDGFNNGFYDEILDNVGEIVAIQKKPGDRWLPIKAVFEREYLQQDFGEMIVENRNPVLQFKESDNIQRDYLVRFDGEDFRIVELQPDGRGVVIAELRIA